MTNDEPSIGALSKVTSCNSIADGRWDCCEWADKMRLMLEERVFTFKLPEFW
jgi:hypothetical protein